MIVAHFHFLRKGKYLGREYKFVERKLINILAARFEDLDHPLEIKEIDKPTPRSNEVLIDIKAAGICGSDLHHTTGEFPTGKTPITLGHEGAGVVEEVGSEVENLQEGDDVIVHYIDACGHCDACLQGFDNRCQNRNNVGYDIEGTFAEYITVSSYCAIKMGSEISYDVGAITGCAVSTAYHASKISELDPGDTAVVFGVGGVGFHAVLWTNFFGAGEVIAVDPVDPKLRRAREYGADVTINPEERDSVWNVIEEETDGLGADVAIECSGSAIAMEEALSSVKGKNQFASGRVISVGLQTEPITAEYWGLLEGALKVSGDHTKFELRRIVKLLENGAIDLSESVTHKVSLEEIEKGLDLIKNEEDLVRVVVDTSP